MSRVSQPQRLSAALKLQMFWRAGKRNDISNIGHARHHHEKAFKPESKSRVWYATETAAIQIPPVTLRCHAAGLNPLFEDIEAFFALAAANQFAHPRHQHIHSRNG